MSHLTPAMQQYVDLKKQHPDCVLLFRLGDFYEVFREDAKICHKVLDLVLTSKNKNTSDPIPMAGIPYHSIDKYIPKLLTKGYKIAIAEQLTDPQPGKIVERAVKQVITPGTYLDKESKDLTTIMALTQSSLLTEESLQISFHLVRGDFGSGEYHTQSFDSLEEVQKHILFIQPAEIVLDVDFSDKETLHQTIQQYLKCVVSISDVPYDPIAFIKTSCSVQRMESFGKAVQEGRERVLALMIHYLLKTQQLSQLQINRLHYHTPEQYVLLDETTIKNLEIFTSSYEQSVKYSLFGVIDTTKTTAGSKLLRERLQYPLKDIDEIYQRAGWIDYYFQDLTSAVSLHKALGDTHDVMNTISRIVYKHPLPILFLKLRTTGSVLFGQYKQLFGHGLRLVGLDESMIDVFASRFVLLQDVFVDDDQCINESGFIRTGYDSDIDRYTKQAFASDQLLLDYKQKLTELTGVDNIKIKYIKNQGYFLELTTKDAKVFEQSTIEGLVKRNTLKTAQRYSTAYLGQIEQQIYEAKVLLVKREQTILTDLQSRIAKDMEMFSQVAHALAILDIVSSFAILSKNKSFTKPTFFKGSKCHIVGGRHPVIEQYLPVDQQFVSNDLQMDNEVHIITGPNMGGKSTFLRQNALMVLMAHCGLRVPAKQMSLGLVDGIFARVGSGDVLAKNQSTFMTEMIEVANILNNASNRSFVIFDELGRGTSTYDGLALTQAIVSYVARKIGCKTLLATHYHELTEMEAMFHNIKNYNVAVHETDKEVVFMKKIVEGGADKSYGIDVAKLAGLPDVILQQARNNLTILEEKTTVANICIQSGQENYGMFGNEIEIERNGMGAVDEGKRKKWEKVESILNQYDINYITPVQALNVLVKIKEIL